VSCKSPISPHGTSVEGRLPGSLAERRDGHQRRAALSAGGSWDSFGRHGSFSLRHQASAPRFSQLTVKIPHLLAGSLSDLCALPGIPTCRLSFVVFALCLFTSLLRRYLFALAP
jgi:hypothetical protein